MYELIGIDLVGNEVGRWLAAGREATTVAVPRLLQTPGVVALRIEPYEGGTAA